VITGLGFKPKALIIFAGWQRDTNNLEETGHQSSVIGLTDGTDSHAMSNNDEDAQVTSDSNSEHRTDALIQLTNEAGGVVAKATLTSLDDDGFTINWTTNNGDESTILKYTAFGGSITVKVGSFESPSSVENGDPNGDTRSITTGLGQLVNDEFCLILFHNKALVLNTAEAHVSTGIGFATSTVTSKQISTCSLSIDGENPSKSARSYDNDNCWIRRRGAAEFEDGNANLTNLDVDGFTMTWNDAPNWSIETSYLLIKGGKWAVVEDSEPSGSTTGSQSKTGIGFKPEFLMFIGTNLATANVGAVDGSNHTLAVTDGTTHAGYDFHAKDNVSPTDNISEIYNDAIYKISDVDNGVLGEASFTSFDTDGYTINFSVNDDTQRNLFGVLAGLAPVIVKTYTIRIPRKSIIARLQN